MNKFNNKVKQHMFRNVEFSINIIVIGCLDCLKLGGWIV